MLAYVVVAIVVLWSAVVVFKNIMPKSANKFFSALAELLNRAGLKNLAKRMTPATTAGGCGSGCSCGDVAKNAIKQHSAEVKTVKWK